MNLNHYSFELTPTETSAGGTLLYIANHLSYKCRNNLNLYKKNELESTFIEIVNPKKSNIIVGVYNKKIRKALDGGNIGCGIFVDLQKAFDTVDHQILLTKLNHYGICGVSND